MAKTITLRYPATCADCGAALEAGARAKYYGRRRIYGLDCHSRHPREVDPAEVVTDFEWALMQESGREQEREYDYDNA